MGHTRLGVELFFVYVASCHTRRKLSFPKTLFRSLLYPTAENILPMEHRCYSTDFILIGIPPFFIILAHTRSEKIWRKETGYPMPLRSGGIFIQMRNLHHWMQAVLSFWYTVAENLCDRYLCVP